MTEPLANPGELFDRYGATVYRRALRMLGDEELAHDAVQEVFVRAITHSERFRGDCAPLTWLYRVTTTHCLQQLRNHSTRQRKLAQLGADLALAAVLERSTAEDQVTVREIVAELDPATRQIAYCRLIDEMTLEETARVSGLSRKTVAKRLERFRRRARRRLEQEGRDARAR